MQNSKIEWTDHTFNPWVGCTKVSDGCKHCYAETLMDKRYGKVKWGPQGKRIRTSAAYWMQPLRWNREAAAEGVRRRVFCGSLCDVFESKPDQAHDLHSWRTDLFSLIKTTPHLDWLLLTKRPENVAQFAIWYNEHTEDYPNVWLGTSIENQATADERIPHLLKVPAAVRFLSVEPLLGPVLLDNGEYSWLTCTSRIACDENDDVLANNPCCGEFWAHGSHYHGIDWVIVGGESGNGVARPMHPEWVRSLRDQCIEAEVPFFFKQWGEYTPYYEAVDEVARKVVIRELPKSRDGKYTFLRVGKARAGRLLDGREWNEVPQVQP